MSAAYDLAIIGGGINGCGIARDAAGRGLAVYLCEMNDLASGTSSQSTKLIHGGLRYLEYGDFRLVREALREREVLWLPRAPPHPADADRAAVPPRPAASMDCKLLPPTRSLNLTQDPAGGPLKPGMFRTGFEYSDCRVDDARLVVLNARDAAERGATIRSRTKAVTATRCGGDWDITVEDGAGRETIRARALVNAAGPWVALTLSSCLGLRTREKVRLVQGSHVVVPQLFDHDRSYVFQNPDGRIVFAIPYEGAYTLIGTTEVDYVGDPGRPVASAEEIAYLCKAASEYFAKPILPGDVVWSFSGVRPLHDGHVRDPKAATRDYVLELDAEPGRAPLLSIFGGKITTYRRLAEAALERIAPYLPLACRQSAGWTLHAPLPGGDFDVNGLATLTSALAAEFAFLSVSQVSRLAAAYGTRARDILAGAREQADLGVSFGATLTEAEVRYLMAQEWAQTADDVLWRRTKLGLALTDRGRLDRFVAGHPE